MTILSSAMSPSGSVSSRCVNPLPAPAVVVCTVLAPSNRSLAFVVATFPSLLATLLPAAPAIASTGLTGSIPLYSNIRMSGLLAALLKFTLTEFVAQSRCCDIFCVVDGL
jgi:hypothetical protein